MFTQILVHVYANMLVYVYTKMPVYVYANMRIQASKCRPRLLWPTTNVCVCCVCARARLYASSKLVFCLLSFVFCGQQQMCVSNEVRRVSSKLVFCLLSFVFCGQQNMHSSYILTYNMHSCMCTSNIIKLKY